MQKKHTKNPAKIWTETAGKSCQNLEAKFGKNQSGAGVSRINNMVPADPIPESETESEKVKECPKNAALKAISAGTRMTRQLIDLFAVSVSPIISNFGWEIGKYSDSEHYQKVSINRDMTPEHLGWTYTDKQGVRREAVTRDNMTLLMPDEFIAWFFARAFPYLAVDMTTREDIGGGEGYTGGQRYQLFSADGKDDKRGRIQFRYFDPTSDAAKARGKGGYVSKSAYTKSGAEANYIRQKINVKLTGDGLQELRTRNLLTRFLLDLYFWFRDPAVTMYDIATDFFNFRVMPKYFYDLADAGKVLTRSSINAYGPIENPTVYIGKYKQTRTVMIYDKRAEVKQPGKADEPDLLTAVDAREGNTWVRVEVHMARKEHEAEQSWDYIIGTLWHDVRHGLPLATAQVMIENRLGQLAYKLISEKARFLTVPRKDDKHNDRIPTDSAWQDILDGIASGPADFAFQRPVLTLNERMNALYYKRGGRNLMTDYAREYGVDALRRVLDDWLRDITDQLISDEEE